MDENLKKELEAILDGRRVKRGVVQEKAKNELGRRAAFDLRFSKLDKAVIHPALQEIADACCAKNVPASIKRRTALGSEGGFETAIEFPSIPLRVMFRASAVHEKVGVHVKLHDAQTKSGSYPIEDVTAEFVQKTVLDLLKQA